MKLLAVGTSRLIGGPIEARRPRQTGGSALLVLALALWALPVAAQFGDAAQGAEILQRRQCTVCHPVHGVGGDVAPDLARRSTRDFAPSTLAAMMWNHGPAMWRGMTQRNLPVPALTTPEINDLYAYFYSLRYFDPPGDAARGKEVFAAKKCSLCHALTPAQSQKKSPDVAGWPALSDPVLWVQNMWNHGGAMAAEIEKADLTWPRFTVQEMVDLLVYLQNLPGLPSRMSALRLKDPAAGQRIFQDHHCDNCHTLGGRSPGKIDLLAAVQRQQTLTGLAVTMWNHRPLMSSRAGRQQSELTRFEGDEMGQLLGFLFDKGYFEREGKAGRGQRVFNSKGCASCHGVAGSGAPELRGRDGEYSVPLIASAIWQHGPAMLAQMEKKGLPWPQLTGRDVLDLIGYLNSQ